MVEGGDGLVVVGVVDVVCGEDEFDVVDFGVVVVLFDVGDGGVGVLMVECDESLDVIFFFEVG